MQLNHGGWSREVTVRELPIATTLAGVNMSLTPGGVRELHWHKQSEWSYCGTFPPVFRTRFRGWKEAASFCSLRRRQLLRPRHFFHFRLVCTHIEGHTGGQFRCTEKSLCQHPGETAMHFSSKGARPVGKSKGTVSIRYCAKEIHTSATCAAADCISGEGLRRRVPEPVDGADSPGSGRGQLACRIGTDERTTEGEMACR